MKQSLFTMGFIASITLVFGCGKPKAAKSDVQHGITSFFSIRKDSLDMAEEAIYNYGYYNGQRQKPKDSIIRAWLIKGTDFLRAMGMDSADAAQLENDTSKHFHKFIHAYIGLYPLVDNGLGANHQLYLVGADTVSQKNADSEYRIQDFPQDGVYNLTLPCPSACADLGNTSLRYAFDTGYNAGKKTPNRINR